VVKDKSQKLIVKLSAFLKTGNFFLKSDYQDS